MLDYVALALLIFVFLFLFYLVIVVHDIPYEIAKKRNHPHADAIHVAGWVSLLTLHIIWPFLWIWATLYNKEQGWSGSGQHPKQAKPGTSSAADETIAELTHRLERVEAELSSLKKAGKEEA
ncbi:DUF3302 domain-containing protein [Coraliomargarita akajimensis]|uniref:GTPase n=1 Tax=Coraliomargarita akajimensis (strain DSM 45221 / IAM 15411 / JCM 23193 / KCTC 12865 / 04OKA010-24) TaxID=583355 RepID=D5EPF0_CORAD|nr:conserved hypothetical protein [Coraliomargarita akajimensis DSM 45221]